MTHLILPQAEATLAGGAWRYARRRARTNAPQAPWDSEAQARRALNVVVAALGIALTLPLMLGIAILVKLTSPGPILFSQMRVGVDRRRGRLASQDFRSSDVGGRLFRMWKFRSMHLHVAGQVWAAENDPRVTPIGRVLRKYRLDELPQLFNVLAGDMNIVGPRPEQPKIFESLRQQIAHYGRRQRVRPGITGWAQINLHYDRSVDDVRKKVTFDLEYVQRQSVLEDLSIMTRTLPVMLFRRGAW